MTVDAVEEFFYATVTAMAASLGRRLNPSPKELRS
jgi:hypothetical protein